MILNMLNLLVIVSLACTAAFPQEKLLKGYRSHSRGLTMEYHSTQDDATRALLVRCREGLRTMVWETEAIPLGQEGDFARFAWIAGIDVHTPAHRFDVFLNGEKTFTITAPLESSVRSWTMKGNHGATLEFRGTLIDRHGDLFGYMFLTVPKKRFPPGKPVEIKVTAEDAGTNNWFMILRYGVERGVKVRPENAVYREGDERYQSLRVTLLHYGDPAEAVIQAGDSRVAVKLAFGANTVRMRIPAVERITSIPLRVFSESEVFAEKTVEVAPVKPYTVYLIHHSHVDIGYTHAQAEVEKIQWRHLEKAIELARRTQHYPEGARFRWNVEVMWAVDSFFRRGTTAQKRTLRTAIRKGWIELGALFGDQLTGLARGAELFETTRSARGIAAACGVPLDAAMLTDVPGCTWGIVPVLARSGVRYFSMGTNRGHRIGTIIE